MDKTKIRVVIDTNWWLSFVINKFDSQLSEVLLNPKFEVVSSLELKSEIFRILDSPKLQKYLVPDNVENFKAHFDKIVVPIRVISIVNACRDVKDNFLLSLSKDAKADYLITGDKDLLVLNEFGKTKILKMIDFQLVMNSF